VKNLMLSLSDHKQWLLLKGDPRRRADRLGRQNRKPDQEKILANRISLPWFLRPWDKHLLLEIQRLP